MTVAALYTVLSPFPFISCNSPLIVFSLALTVSLQIDIPAAYRINEVTYLAMEQFCYKF